MTPLLEHVPAGSDPDAVYLGFVEWAASRELTLYPAQDEAIIEIVSGANVILSTPTGTGKSLVAVAAHAASLSRGGRTYYTAPIKALVSEKFFALVDIFGAENVGMVTGDSSVNADAPIVCCTAEILANLALRQGADADVDQVVMDEFHYYGEADRGWAWQVPLLLLNRAQFILMSATLGDVEDIADDLSRRTGRPTARVTGVERPVPLHFEYARTPVHETVQELLDTKQAPIYVVHFSQAAAMERAQALSSIRIIGREQRDEIAEAIGGFRFTTGFGKTLSRYVRAGIGVHHAGMLPRYRRLVETLAQRGLLRVICGTDTLGVGINVPIRTVLMTALTKYDGTRMRQLSAREFHQIAGRAGRAGYDTAGTVVVMAPDHEIENAAQILKAGDDLKKQKKIVRKKAPQGFVNWTEQSYDRLVAAEPEPLVPQMKLSAAMLINVIARGGDVFGNVRSLVFDNHEPRPRQYELARRAIAIFRTLVQAGVVEVVPPRESPNPVASGGSEATIPGESRIRLTVDLQPNFALNQPLSPFALAAIEMLDPEVELGRGPDATAAAGGVGTGHYALDVVSVIEATLDDPRPILSQQQFRARGEAVAAMKREGIEYDERMELLEEITWPKPLDDLLAQAYEVFASSQPWIRDFDLSPKSVVRDMFERACSFGEYVSLYQLARSEGLVLRYLSDAYRAIRQTVPVDAQTPDLLDLIAWLGELVRQVDSSLVDEWEQLINPADDPDAPVVPPAPPSVLTNRRAFVVLVRNEMFRRVQLAALQRDEELVELDPDVDWPDVLDRYFDEHDAIGTGGAARSSALVDIDEAVASDGIWRVEQTIDDPAGDHDWRIRAEVDLAASEEEGTAIVRVTEVLRL
ncbi:Helicase conserved C-terminal domain-containing protein [Microbacterium sp. ru370.1]|uniref:DEAD/DEAH box helicase n=1 Tax=unclassified Microbacterium TaxID=2609290 RepID=UPI00088C5D39|nr:MULTISPECIES: DEAD/DEAH box helicase [unclassified Microbacterium]SDO96787.1 Helicase conserved C-terminal domain-containing protein [Microbacterium sp. ru370.1]SIT92853.1 Helicase conserved C-terminal domain-containing protein [Microbacterium sp. RU1D]